MRAKRVTLAAAMVLGAWTPPLHAQDTALVDAGMYRLWQGNLEAFRETFRETRSGAEGTTVVPIQRFTLRWREERGCGRDS